MPFVLEIVVLTAVDAGSNGIPFLLKLLEKLSEAIQNKNALLKNQPEDRLDRLHQVISGIAHSASGIADDVEGSKGLLILSTILEKKLLLSYHIIGSMVLSAVEIGGKAGADFLIKMLEENSSNKIMLDGEEKTINEVVQDQVAGQVRYMKEDREAIRVLLAVSEKNLLVKYNGQFMYLQWKSEEKLKFTFCQQC